MCSRSLTLILITPLFLLFTACGQMESQKSIGSTAIDNLTGNGALTADDVADLTDADLSQTVEVADTGTGNSMMMKVGGADLLIDFMEQITGEDSEIAMIINGVDVPNSIARDQTSFQGLITSLVQSQLDGIDLFGIPASTLVNAGLAMMNNSQDDEEEPQEKISGLFGTLIRGALNMFVGGSGIGNIVSSLAGPLLGGVLDNFGGDQNSNANNNQSNQNQGLNGNDSANNQGNNNGNQNSSEGGLLGGIINTVGGLIGGGNTGNSSPFGGIFNLISNLF